MSHLASQVSAKLEEGDFCGAIWLVCSEDSIAPQSEEVYTALKQIHLAPHPTTCIPPGIDDDEYLPMGATEDEIAKAIYSFPSSSAGGPDGLRPRHLKDLTGPFAIGGGRALLAALAQFVKHVLEGKTPHTK